MKRSEDRDRRSRRSRSQDYMDNRRQIMLIEQEREKKHKRLMDEIFLKYKVARESILRSKESSRRSSSGSTKSRLGPSDETRFDDSELRRLKVNIYRNIPDATNANREVQCGSVNQDEVTLKRREDEGVKPIFERDELKLPDCSKSSEEIEEHRIVKTIETVRTDSPTRRSKHSSSSKRRKKTTQEASLCWRENDPESCNREREKHDRLHDNSSDRTERKYSAKHRPSRERSYSGHRNAEYDSSSRDGHSHREYRGRSRHRREKLRSVENRRSRMSPISHYRKRHNSECNLSRHDRDRYSHREYRGRSRDRQEKKRSIENRDRERSRERRMSTLPNYIEHIPIPVYYGNFPPRPGMMGPMMPIRGPLMRNRLPFGPRIPFPPQFIHPDMYRPSLPPYLRFNRMF